MLKTVRSAHIHFNLRWLGAILLVSGIVLLLNFVSQLFTGGSVLTAIFSFVSCGLSLGSFGINHDTAIAYAVQAKNEGISLSEHPVLETELNEDLNRDRSQTLSLKPHSILSYLIPFITLLLHGYLWSLVLQN